MWPDSPLLLLRKYLCAFVRGHVQHIDCVIKMDGATHWFLDRCFEASSLGFEHQRFERFGTGCEHDWSRWWRGVAEGWVLTVYRWVMQSVGVTCSVLQAV